MKCRVFFAWSAEFQRQSCFSSKCWWYHTVGCLRDRNLISIIHLIITRLTPKQGINPANIKNSSVIIKKIKAQTSYLKLKSTHTFNLFSPKPFFVAILISSFTIHIKTAAAIHGPEYFQGLLAQSEDEIIKPNRALGTEEGITRVRNSWREYISSSRIITFN